ncbi:MULTISPECIES: DUF4439 domain-containing protein [Arthrobacter]|uniref:DUF4439 domain-containing protein n=2 Tax=Arthrobacter TaxID=1663 RepID=A0ABU9KMB2_9MICC|nr:DUF4439 domain-containing protein [Arthrobacter sp. YJM1]MDP5227821.1 DUF4439 domain-containing protein [Arthrobacter sp. YJM1]
MKNLGKRRLVAVGRLIPLTVITLLVVGLSAGEDFLRPAPADPTESETAQARLSARSQELAEQARILDRTASGTFSGLAEILGTQAAALAIPGTAPATATPSGTASSAPTPSAGPFLDDAVRSVHDLLDRAAVEPDPGLARLYASAALGRLNALTPVSAGRPTAALTAQSLTPAPSVPQSGCVTGVAASAPSGSPTPGAGTPGTTAAGQPMSDAAADATRALLRTAGRAEYLYQVALPRQDTAGQRRSATSLGAVGNITRDGLAWLASACRPDGLAAPGYSLPPSFLSSPGPALGAAEAELTGAGLDLVASAGPGERVWALRVVLGSAVRAKEWGAGLSGSDALPGLPVPPATAPVPTPSSSR